MYCSSLHSLLVKEGERAASDMRGLAVVTEAAQSQTHHQKDLLAPQKG